MRSVQDWKNDPKFVLALQEFPKGLEGVVSTCLCRKNGTQREGFQQDATYLFDARANLSWTNWTDWIVPNGITVSNWAEDNPDTAIQAAFELGYIEEAMRCKRILDELRTDV